ncbi:MAG: adenosine deaminase [Geobacteraceae bacterium]|nr:adenosine deaminase [Geobacteraceae bacterium]
MKQIETLIRALPKTELHLHIEGTLEPEMLFQLARRNNITLPYEDVAAVRAAYDFTNLQSFLDIYYAGASVLVTEEDFFELTLAYLAKCAADRVVHTELFFDPQSHTSRGIPFATVLSGIRRAMAVGKERFGISSKLIMSFLRHLPEEDGFKTLDDARPFLALIDGVGLDSSEMGHPPADFQRLFAMCRALGLRRVAHAGEEGPAAYICEALDMLDVCRIDHGVRAIEDDSLLERLAKERLPLTVCPFSNVRLKVFASLAGHNLRRLLQRGVCVTVNSDDPAYFGGYLQDNLLGVARELGLSADEIVTLVKNGFEASWLDEAEKTHWLGVCDTIAGEGNHGRIHEGRG